MRPSVELSMIVKNGGAGLARCLESVAGVVDRMVIGDTGSTDDSVSIAQHFGAEILPIAWHDDFAQARNEMLSTARCDWILVLDADEMLNREEALDISHLLFEGEFAGYDLTRWNYVQDLGFRSSGEQARINPRVFRQAEAYPAYFPTVHTRLFRRDSRIRFDHCVHESVAPAMDAAHLLRGRASMTIHHFGYVEDTKQARDGKDTLYHRLALRKLAQASTTYEANLEAGISELDYKKNPQEALQHFTAAVSLDPGHYGGWLYRGICLTRLHRYGEALGDLKRAATLRPHDPFVYSAMGDVHFHTGVYADAAADYIQALVYGDASPITQAKLGACEVQVGHREAGLARVEEAAAACPSLPEILDILATTAFIAGRPGLACKAARQRLTTENLSSFQFVLAATLHIHTDDPVMACVILQQGQLLFPDDLEIKRLIALSSSSSDLHRGSPHAREGSSGAGLVDN